jgi:hypothetical protein
MEPMYSYPGKEKFTKVFFMNDIIFCSEDVIHLINMQDVDAVSGIDIIDLTRNLHTPTFQKLSKKNKFKSNVVYDTWVLRDL